MMKNKFLSRFLGVLFALLIFTGCEDSIEGEEVNANPFEASNINPELLFPQVIVAGLSANRTIEINAMNMQAQLWSSIVGFGVFVNPERYIISPFTTGNTWTFMFQNSLRNLGQIVELTEANNPSALNIIGQAQVLQAFTFLNLTQIFEDIPFDEAIQVAEFPSPNFNTQEEVLRGICVLLDEAVANLATDTDIISGADFLYQGDRQSWVRFANSLKLKALMIIANVDPASVQAQIQDVANRDLITDASENAVFNYINAVGNENPIWRTIDRFAGGNNTFWGGATTLIDIMNSTNDPRRATFFDAVGGAFVGQDQGVNSPTGISAVSLNIIREDMPDIYSSASETNFYLAEAALTGLITGDANAFYQAGIQESLDFYDNQPGPIAQADKDAFLASPRGTITGLSQADALDQIHVEQWIADFTRPIEAWTDWRRNQVPAFQLPVQAVLTDIIRRYPVPVEETGSNPNAPPNQALDVPMWFEN